MQKLAAFPRAARVLLSLTLLITTSVFTTHAGGIVSQPTQAALQAALAGGGEVTFAFSGTITLTNELIISTSTSLDAQTNLVVISGGNAVRLFLVESNVTFSVRGLTLVDGSFRGADGQGGTTLVKPQPGMGAAIACEGGTVILNDCTLTNHSVRGGDGAAYLDAVDPNPQGGAGLGAAIWLVNGRLSLTNSVIGQCRAAGGAPTFIGDYTGFGGRASGGAVYCSNGVANLVNVTLLNSAALGAPPPMRDGNAHSQGGDGTGGAITLAATTAYFENCVLSNNVALGGEPDYFVSISSGPMMGSGQGGALYVAADSSALIAGSSFMTNYANGGDGTRQRLPGLSQGGAVFAAGVTSLRDCVFSDNRVQCPWAPVHLSADLGQGQGGAIYATNRLAVTGCAFIGNQAVGGPSVSVIGGGIPGATGAGGGIWTSSMLGITNSTFNQNIAIGGLGNGMGNNPSGPSYGGALAMWGGSATLVHVTIAGNRAESDLTSNPPGPTLGGGISVTNGSLTAVASILANNASGGDAWGLILDGGYNICSDSTANFTSVSSLDNTDPMLSALSLNGGLTPSMPLLVGSPARDRVPETFVAIDQRGTPRPQGPAADIGAFEADYVPSAPLITTQPHGMTVRAGGNVTFSVVAVSSQPLFYAWHKDGQIIPGANAASLLLTNVQAFDAGVYSVLVTNSLGSALSQGAALVVDSTPLILDQPISMIVVPGANAAFSVTAVGPQLAYQWWHQSNSIAGATNSVLGIPQATAGAAGEYFVVVTNFAGAVTSQVATLIFDSSALTIVTQPKDQTVEEGSAASFSVSVTGVSPFAYQWRHEGVPISGATNSPFTIPVVQLGDAGTYDVVVSNEYRTVLSAQARLTVTPGAFRPILRLDRYGTTLAITFSAEAGRSYRLLSSADMSAWTTVSTKTALSAGPLQFVQQINGSQQFYRVVTP